MELHGASALHSCKSSVLRPTPLYESLLVRDFPSIVARGDRVSPAYTVSTTETITARQPQTVYAKWISVHSLPGFDTGAASSLLALLEKHLFDPSGSAVASHVKKFIGFPLEKNHGVGSAERFDSTGRLGRFGKHLDAADFSHQHVADTPFWNSGAGAGLLSEIGAAGGEFSGGFSATACWAARFVRCSAGLPRIAFTTLFQL